MSGYLFAYDSNSKKIISALSHLNLYSFRTDVCIVGVARTPMGGLLGTLSSLSATKLGSIVIECNHYYSSLFQLVFSVFFFP